MNSFQYYSAIIILILSGIVLFRSNLDVEQKIIFGAIILALITIMNQINELSTKQ